MIYVDRKSVKTPDILTDDNTKRGKKETNKNIGFFETGVGSLSFSIYSDIEVKDALIELFNSKCAYCESKFLHVYSGDVEHFRPKGEIEEALPNKQPGYYWLAADWDNLLLSCRNCNQKLKHLVWGETNKKTMGKMNQFPLKNSYKHVQTHVNHPIETEKEEPYRLLINPCKDNPELHLEYDEMNAIIKPIKKNGIENEMGKKSIEVYVLQRMPLVQARERVLIEIWAQIQRVTEAASHFNNALSSTDNSKKFLFDKILKRELARLKKFTNKEEEFAGMARQIIGKFLNFHFNIPIA